MARKEGYRWRRGAWQPTERQREVLDLLLEGKSNAEIAVRLGMSVDGAKWHVGELLSQTGCADRQALAAWWRRERGRKAGWALLPWSGLRRVVAASAVAGAGLVAVVFAVALFGGGPDPAPETADVDRPSPVPWTPVPEESAFEPQLIPMNPTDMPQGCPVSGFWRLRPEEDVSSTMAFGTGDGKMAWLSWATITEWHGPTQLQAARWSITTEITGDAVLTGQHLDGDSVALFANGAELGGFSESIVLPAPHDASHLIYTITPRPGCWQFTLRGGNSVTVITVYKKGEPIPPSCPISESSVVRPNIAPGIGDGSVWMISPQVMPWLGEDVPMRTIWLIDDSVSGEVRLSGERLDAPGVATFVSVEDVPGFETAEPRADQATVDAIDARNRDRLLAHRRLERVIEPPHDLRLNRFGYIFYPSPGCWRFTAETDQETHEIVQYLSPGPP